MKTYAVIGRGFGDEGKGLAVDYLASQKGKTLVVRHNGGAQSGHTVEIPGKRFVFHELSSGSFRGAHTLWAKTFYPDLYKLIEEYQAFEACIKDCQGERSIKIFADVRAQITIVDDVFINMALETKRGENRHGSCGMGINEADLRSRAGYGISVSDIFSLSEEEIQDKWKRIRKEYIPKRLLELKLTLSEMGEYGQMLADEDVLKNAIREMVKAKAYISPVTDMVSFIQDYDRIVFEAGQGLLLDANCTESMPHVTASRTGLMNPMAICEEMGISLDEVLYVTRSYLTRHGAGPLKYPCNKEILGEICEDQTNLWNHWQGSVRYGFHEDIDDFLKPVLSDMEESAVHKASFLITHLNETQSAFKTHSGDYTPEQLYDALTQRMTLQNLYLSDTKYSKDIRDWKEMKE